MRYRLYIDESGDHTSSHQTIVGKRYLGLVGVSFEQEKAYRAFAKDLEEFKRNHLAYDPDEPPILHREDIINTRGPFSVLQDPARKARFDDGLIDLIGNTKCVLIAVVLDKLTHWEAAYRRLRHPYHYCLVAMLERYCGRLKFYGHKGDVMAESRGRVEDGHLKIAFNDLYTKGKMFLSAQVSQTTLTSQHLKLKPKHANIAGLQLADVLAHPLTRDVLCAYKKIQGQDGDFAARICQASETKYNRQVYQNRINGYGRVILG